jgi:capsular polysaccharide transport system permease protein
VTAALIVREMSTRFGSKPGGYRWAIFDPVAHVALLTLIFQVIARMPALGLSFPLFFASGYLPFAFYQRMSGFMAGTVKANKALFSYPIAPPFDAIEFALICCVAGLVLLTGSTREIREDRL